MQKYFLLRSKVFFFCDRSVLSYSSYSWFPQWLLKGTVHMKLVLLYLLISARHTWFKVWTALGDINNDIHSWLLCHDSSLCCARNGLPDRGRKVDIDVYMIFGLSSVLFVMLIIFYIQSLKSSSLTKSILLSSCKHSSVLEVSWYCYWSRYPLWIGQTIFLKGGNIADSFPRNRPTIASAILNRGLKLP